MDIEEWDLLNERQQEQAENYTELVLKFDMFDQSSGADGAHYAPADKNPFKADGLICQNCVFFNEENNQCQIVAGMIEPEAVCKLWIIPEASIVSAQASADAMRKLDMKRRRLDLLKSI